MRAGNTANGAGVIERMCESEQAEKWLPIPGCEGVYEVSDKGRVKSLERDSWFINRWGHDVCRTVPESIRKPFIHKNGSHRCVCLHKEGVRSTHFVHNLVLLAFVGARPGGFTETRHLDGDVSNNSLSNLAYGTHAENVADMMAHGTHVNASKDFCKRGHPFDAENTYWRPDGKGRSCRACGREYGRKNGARHQRDYRSRKRASKV